MSAEKSRPTSISVVPESPVRKEISAALDTITKVEYLDSPLSDVVTSLAETHRVHLRRKNPNEQWFFLRVIRCPTWWRKLTIPTGPVPVE